MDSEVFLLKSGRLFVVAPWDDSQHPITMRYLPGHKAKIHQKIVEDASERVRAEGLSGAVVAAVYAGHRSDARRLVQAFQE